MAPAVPAEQPATWWDLFDLLMRAFTTGLGFFAVAVLFLGGTGP